ncbi:hypothetical protein [Aquitalea aquatilis]|uniref:hypothetical protein n=1 Tax=Aquitalea aquatilis TaxID=1537400 RepID=UPI0010BD30C5|nr:hypothetical protein [Aquitalea aquatilis]
MTPLRQPLPLKLSGAAGHPFHGLVEGGYLKRPGLADRSYRQPSTAVSFVLRVPGQPVADPLADVAAGYQFLDHAMLSLSDGAIQLYGRLWPCEWIVALGVGDVWGVTTEQAGIVLVPLRGGDPIHLPMDWGAAGQRWTGTDSIYTSVIGPRVVEVSQAGEQALLEFYLRNRTGDVLYFYQVTVTLSRSNASAIVAEFASVYDRQGSAFAYRRMLLSVRMQPTYIQSVITERSDYQVGNISYARAVLRWYVGDVDIGGFTMVTNKTMAVVEDLTQQPDGRFGRDDLLLSDYMMFEQIGQSAVLVKGKRIIGPGAVVDHVFGVVDALSGVITPCPEQSRGYAAVHPVSREIAWSNQSIAWV